MKQVRILVFDKALPGESTATCFVVGWPDKLNAGQISHVLEAMRRALGECGVEVTKVTFESDRNSRTRA